MIPKHVDSHMKDTLREAIRILFPVGVEPDDVVKRHVWGNRKYVGISDGRVLAWRGWSANLARIDRACHAVYFDFVKNEMPPHKCSELFGDEFCQTLDGLSAFVIAFVAGLPSEATSAIQSAGFVVRTIGKNVHACKLVSPREFIAFPSIYWAAYVARLINLQEYIIRGKHEFERHTSDTKSSPDWIMQLDWEDDLGLLDL